MQQQVFYFFLFLKAYFIGLCTHLDDIALFHWLVQNQDCWLSTTKKLLNSHQTLFLVREQNKTNPNYPLLQSQSSHSRNCACMKLWHCSNAHTRDHVHVPGCSRWCRLGMWSLPLEKTEMVTLGHPCSSSLHGKGRCVWWQTGVCWRAKLCACVCAYDALQTVI